MTNECFGILAGLLEQNPSWEAVSNSNTEEIYLIIWLWLLNVITRDHYWRHSWGSYSIPLIIIAGSYILILSIHLCLVFEFISSLHVTYDLGWNKNHDSISLMLQTAIRRSTWLLTEGMRVKSEYKRAWEGGGGGELSVRIYHKQWLKVASGCLRHP
jgi:hypothetical protein